MPFIVEIHDLDDTGHGELMEIITAALHAKEKQFDKVRVSFEDRRPEPTVTYVQNIFVPQGLDPAEIYRNTKDLLKEAHK